MKKILSAALCFIMLLSVPVTVQAASVGNVKGICFYSVETDSIRIKWKKVKKATGYQIYCSTKKKSGYIKVKTVKKGKKVKAKISGLKPNKKYYFRIRAVKGKKKGKLSKPVKVVTKAENPDAALPEAYKKVLEETKTNASEEYYVSAYYNTLDMLTPYGKQKALVVTAFYSAYNEHSKVYVINGKGEAELYLDLPGALNYITESRTDFLTYNYQGSGMGGYVFFKYNEMSREYDKTESYYFEMNTRDSVTETVSKKAKDFLLFEYDKYELPLI